MLYQRTTFARKIRERRAAIVVLAAVMLTAIVVLLAMAVDLGYMVLVRSQLQVAADSAALAGASSLAEGPQAVFSTADRFACYHTSGGYQLFLLQDDVELGFWDRKTREFLPGEDGINAVRVRVRRSTAGGNPAPLVFARALGKKTVDLSAQAVAARIPRDIVFVVDVSESMNDETEPGWATDLLNQAFADYPNAGTDLMQRVYHDFGFGDYPGNLEHIGQPWGVSANEYAYAELTSNDGPLAQPSVPAVYRIQPGDDAATRKIKAYSAIIDYQIARLMPNANPPPNSRVNYACWEKYLDYIIAAEPLPSGNTSTQPGRRPPDPRLQPRPGHDSKKSRPASIPANDRAAAGGRSFSTPSGGTNGTSPGNRPPQHNPYPGVPGTPTQPTPVVKTTDHICEMHNPNQAAFPEASSQLPARFVNKIGYLTYVQFMMDYGRDLKPDGVNNVPLSRESRFCPYHTEATSAGYFRFPPREEPIHSIRRSLIEAIQLLKEQNGSLPMDQRDWVSIAAFDTPIGGNVSIVQPLTPDYDQAMLACTQLQASGDKGLTTNLEAGLIMAREHLQPGSQGGAGRRNVHKVVIVLTDGFPNCAVSSTKLIQDFASAYIESSSLSAWSEAELAALVQAVKFHHDGWSFYPIGVGAGANHEFVEEFALCVGLTRNGGTFDAIADHPVGRVEKIVQILRQMIDHPRIQIVQ
jgi:Mg-chelatase subunit ChlD